MSNYISWWLIGPFRKRAANKLLFLSWYQSDPHERVRAALEAGADPNYNPTEKEIKVDDLTYLTNKGIPLIRAIYGGTPELVQLLVDAGATLDEEIVSNAYKLLRRADEYPSEARNSTPILEAAKKTGIYDIVEKKYLKEQDEQEKRKKRAQKYYEPLFRNLEAAWFWGKDNGYPSLMEYPQVPELLDIGKAIGTLGGVSLMKKALDEAKKMARAERDYLGGYTAIAEKAWDGICGWMY